MRLCNALPGLALLCSALLAVPQETPVRPGGTAASSLPVPARLGADVWRLEGRDAWSGVRYVRLLLLSGDVRHEVAEEEKPDLKLPTLTGQCTQDAQGKLRFELFANFGGVPDAAFYPPWHREGDELFPPRTPRTMLTMEFLGYTKVKPVKRQFEQVLAPGPEQMRYLNPGAASPNMEPASWVIQYLRALPILRLSGAGHLTEFATAAWIAALHKEPLCAASGA